MGVPRFKVKKLFSWAHADVGILFALYLLTFTVILPIVCRDWVYSWYFVGDPSSSRMATRALDVNMARLVEAETYFQNLQPGGHEVKRKRTTDATRGKDKVEVEVDLAIGIVSVKRPMERKTGYHLGYLTQVAATVHRLVRSDTCFKSKVAFVCNVDAKPLEHEEVEKVKGHLRVAVKYSGNSTEPVDDGQQAVFEKEKDDYGYCLRQALVYNPKYILILEDDAIPKADFLKVIHRLLQFSILHPGSARDEAVERPKETFGYLKLFYPPKWQGYANEIPRLGELLGIAITGGSAVTIFGHVWPRGHLRAPSGLCRSLLINLLYFTFGALYALLVAVTVGRQYVLDLYALSAYTYRAVPAPGCCTQAVLYPAHLVSSLALYLTQVQSDIDFSVDLVVDRFMAERRLEGFLVEPSVVRHVGMLSSLRHYDKHAAEFIF